MKSKNSSSIPLDQFIDLSLYNKQFGYYMKKNPFGKKGDFITAPNISRLFSEMIAIWVISFWQSLGSPKKFNLIELGAGNGEMMKVLIESFKNFPNFLKSCNLVIHEKSPLLIKVQKKKLVKAEITWVSKISKYFYPFLTTPFTFIYYYNCWSKYHPNISTLISCCIS